MEKIKSVLVLLCSIVLSYKDLWHLKKKIPTIKSSFLRRVSIRAYEKKLAKYGSWIGWNANFSHIPCFPHGYFGVFISGDATIGKNAVIFHHVTIGSNTLMDSKGKGSPTIGDNCYIGAGAKIIGNVVVGNNCRIGANAIVTKDIPDNSVVVVDNIRIIHKENMDNRFYRKIREGTWGYYDNGKVVECKKELQ